MMGAGEGRHTVAARAMHLEARTPEVFDVVVIIPNLLLWMKSLRSLIFSSTPGSSLFFAVYLANISFLYTQHD